ncbi:MULTISPECIES: universal stress protein [Halococcus]|uniref:universal stress protein n=1 Tax=Halococcus TaxID=2249 RepID=UPI000E7316F4|nr:MULTISPECIES: universal stress protein [Halococcus]RJT06191.1 universal stress protein [Halococcus sp. IIIV-5B]
MKILAPVDSSERSREALRFAAGMVRAFGGELHAVHITDVRGSHTEELLDKARAVLDEEGIEEDPEVVMNLTLHRPRASDRIGRDILRIAAEEECDHIVMGHYGEGRIGRAILGSAAETVVRAAEIPVTIIP